MEIGIKCGIYKITSADGKVYIGESKDIYKRWSRYRGLYCKSQKKLHSSFKEHKVENHTFEIIEECPFEDLKCRERYWQDFYDVTGENGLNCVLTQCGVLKAVKSDITIKRHSDAQRGENNSMYGRRGELSPLFGKVPSEETCKKISISHKGKVLSEEHKANMIIGGGAFKKGHIPKVAKKVINSKTLEVYNSIREAADYNSMTYGQLYPQLVGYRKNKTNLLLLEEYNKLKNE